MKRRRARRPVVLYQPDDEGVRMPLGLLAVASAIPEEHVVLVDARLDMVPRGNLYWGKVMITFFGQDQTGNQSRLASFEQPITVDADRYNDAVARGYFAFETTVEVEGGYQSVYVGIEDAISGHTSIMPQQFDF